MMKTPLRLLNDRSSAFKHINNIIPDNQNDLHFPFFVSGGLELLFCEHGKSVFGYTHWWCVEEFWNCLKSNPARLIEMIKHTINHKFLDERFYHYMQENFQTNMDIFVRAAQFYVLNRCNEEGKIFGGKYIDKKYMSDYMQITLKNTDISKLNIQHVETDNIMGIIDLIPPENFLILTPPKFTYGLIPDAVPDTLSDPSINHLKLKELLKNKHNWVIVYKKHNKIIDMYKDYDIKYFNKYWVETDKKNAEEIIIVNT